MDARGGVSGAEPPSGGLTGGAPPRPVGGTLGSPSQKDFEADDPYELVAVQVPTPPGYDGPAEMARCFIEEYALMGWPPARIMTLFRSRAFAGTHAVYEERGEAYVQALIDEVFGGRR